MTLTLSRSAPAWLAAALLVGLTSTTAPLRAGAQAANSPQPARDTQRPDCNKETGGRLQFCGETVVVTADATAPVRESSVATKIETPLIQTPRSVTVIDRQTLDDLGVVNTVQAHDYAVGLTPLDERGPAFSRGFPVEFYDLRRDGLRTYAWSVREPVAVERMQYLRGPAAVLYGDGSPGALVNMVLKKPLPAPRREIAVSAGSLGFRRLTADLAGPLTAGRGVRYRLVAAGEWLENGFDNDERRLTILPTVEVDIGKRGLLTVDAEWYDQHGRSYRHVVPATPAAQRGDLSAYPWNVNIGSPDRPFGWTGGNVSPGIRLDLGIGAQSSVHIAGRYTKIDGDINNQGLVSLAADGRTANRFQYHETSTWHEFQTDSFVTTTVQTGRIEHRLVAGVEAGLSTADSNIGVGAAAPLDLLNPVYTAPVEPAPALTRYGVTRAGFYAVDQVRLAPSLILVPGVRFTGLDIENRVATTGETRSSQHVVSPSIGVVALPRQWLSLYTTYAQGVSPPTPGQYLQDGRGLEPAEHDMVEGGVKADLVKQRLSVTGSGYRIRRTNVPEADVLGFYRQIGAAESHGLEVEAVGSIARGFGMRGGYAWTSTEITRDTSGFVGRELPNAPRHKTQVWARYRFMQGAFARLMLSGGVVSVSRQYAVRSNLVVLPAYTRVDASTSYALGGSPFTIMVVAQNLTDRRYATSGTSSTFIVAPARRVAVQLTSAF